MRPNPVYAYGRYRSLCTSSNERTLKCPSRTARSNTSRSRVSRMPPCPAATSFLPWRLNTLTSPKVPTIRPSHIAPCAWEQSSTTFSPWRRATSRTGPIDTGLPHRWVTTMARVRSVTSSSRRDGSRFPVSGSASTRTGTELVTSNGMTVARKVYVGARTSSPGCRPNPKKAECNAAVPELVANAYGRSR